MSDPDVLKEIQRQRKHGSSSGVIDETLVETIMAQIPNISNRNILKRSNLLDEMFMTEFDTVVDSKGAEISTPVTSTKDLSTLIQLVCEKRGYNEDNCKLSI